MSLTNEIKRKAFHHLALVYMLIYAVTPPLFSVIFFFVLLVIVAAGEFLRLRRPEMNAWFLNRLGGIHRRSEVLQASGIFWTLLGTWMTMVVFTDKKIVLAALGFLVFGDTAAALGGRKWGKRPWPHNPKKTYEGSACFAVVSAAWALLFVHWPVAILAALTAAWVEARAWPLNDNFWIPLISALALSIFNLALGRHG